MKTIFTSLLAILVALNAISQSQYELVKQSITRSGSLNQISKSIEIDNSNVEKSVTMIR